MKIEKIISLVDFTSLNSIETKESINKFIDKALSLEAEGLVVAGVCTYSNYSNILTSRLSDSKVKSVVVVGGFPHSQVPLDIKIQEIEYAIQQGIDEIDIVLSQDLIQEKNLGGIKNELNLLRNACQGKVLKVILETGHFNSMDLLSQVSKICCEVRIDFIKTSSGKISEGATAEKVSLICQEIKKYYVSTGQKTGLKVSGGIRTKKDALVYIDLAEQILGKKFLSSDYFRIGASSLISDLLK